jgi:hypothetical protein
MASTASIYVLIDPTSEEIRCLENLGIVPKETL